MISGLITPTQRQWLNSLFLVIAMAMISYSSIAAERWQSLTQPVFQTIEHSARPLVGPIRATAQDRDGYIWLVSDTTLWRWDAYQLVQVTFNLTSIKNDIIPDINIIKSDPNGDLWIGTTNGLYRINQSLLKLEPVVVNALNNQTIDLIEFDYRNGKKRMFLGNEYHVLEWQVGTQTVNRLSLGKDTENRVHAMAIDSTQQLYVGTTNGLLIKSLDEPTNSPLRISSTMSVERRISALFIDSAQQLWIGTAKHGVYLINQKQQLQVIPLPKQTSSSPWIYDITEIRPGILWFGTYGKGILQFESANQTVTSIRQQRGLTRNLLDNDIWSFFKDTRGLIWIGTRRGVNIYDPSQSAFHYIPGDMNGPNGVRDSQIFSVIATNDDHLWLGTGSNGIEIIHPEKGYVQQLQPGQRFGSIPIPDDAIETLFLADQQTVLASSNWSTLHISRQPLSVKALILEGRDSDAFSGAFVNHHGNLWVGGIDGLWRLSGVDRSEALNVTKGKPVDYRISKMLSTKDALWVGTWKGLYSVTEKNSAVPAWQITPVKDTFLNQQYITDLAQDAKQRIWVGTYSAGLLHNTAEGIAGNLPWQIISAKQGLPGNSVASIKADLIGNLWVATSQGIAVINVNTLKIDAIPSEQGSAAAPYEDGALTAAGEIAFVGNNGLTIIDPKLWQAINFKAPIALSNIDSNSDKKLSLQKTKMADGQWKKTLVLSPNINRVSIEFSALDFVAASQLKYRYRLIGFDKNWVELDAKHRTATFTTLAPRIYEMQVQYSSDGQNWQNGTFSLFIDMQPTWYQKTWVILLMLAAVIVLIILLFQWRANRYLHEQHELEQLISERTTELEQANSLLKEQTLVIEEASLTDPLTGLKNRRYFSQHIETDIALTDRLYLNNIAGTDDSRNADLIFFIIDIDYFKLVNDRWGHASGDAVLIEMHHRLARVFRESDYIVRWGGEEFLAVARGTSRKNAAEVAERICQSVSQQPFTVSANQQHTVTCSIGYASYPFFCDQPKALNWSETLAIADAALYASKSSGRNTWTGFDNSEISSTSSQASHIKISPKAAFQMESITVRKGSIDLS